MVAVISDDLWRRSFGANPGVIGRVDRVEDEAVHRRSALRRADSPASTPTVSTSGCRSTRIPRASSNGRPWYEGTGTTFDDRAESTIRRAHEAHGGGIGGVAQQPARPSARLDHLGGHRAADRGRRSGEARFQRGGFGADRRRRVHRAAHRVRERREHADAARVQPAPRDRRASRARRVDVASVRAAHHRERDARFAERCGRAPVRERGPARRCGVSCCRTFIGRRPPSTCRSRP